jgi:hypothetical protein
VLIRCFVDKPLMGALPFPRHHTNGAAQSISWLTPQRNRRRSHLTVFEPPTILIGRRD